MVDRKPEYAKTNEEFWQDRFESPDDIDIPEDEPAVYIGEERYDSVEEAAEDVGVEPEELRDVLYGSEESEISSPVDLDKDPRVVEFERVAGVTMDRPGNNPSHYDQNGQRPEDKEPHTEGPEYDRWATGFESEEAMNAFSGLFNDEESKEIVGHSSSEGDRAFGSNYDAGLQ
ncbi:hypothetical protein GKQ38_04165 [Candidatus Nanohaloarchaea archaeon]|nr:hypothetical protein GKQ38_04165 [Candidatus Nanohaloarchaea archaeon]